jgi:hypothetical protein
MRPVWREKGGGLVWLLEISNKGRGETEPPQSYWQRPRVDLWRRSKYSVRLKDILLSLWDRPFIVVTVCLPFLNYYFQHHSSSLLSSNPQGRIIRGRLQTPQANVPKENTLHPIRGPLDDMSNLGVSVWPLPSTGSMSDEDPLISLSSVFGLIQADTDSVHGRTEASVTSRKGCVRNWFSYLQLVWARTTAVTDLSIKKKYHTDKEICPHPHQE